MSCTWTQEDEDGPWETTCQLAVTLEWGTPSTHAMAFCDFCGRRLVWEQPWRGPLTTEAADDKEATP